MVQFATVRRLGGTAVIILALSAIGSCSGNAPQPNPGHPLAGRSASEPLPSASTSPAGSSRSTPGGTRSGNSGANRGSGSGGSGGQQTGSPSPPPTAQPVSGPTTQPGSPTPVPGVLACATSDLRGSIGPWHLGVAAGSSYYPLVLKNVSGSTCTLYGYPGVVLVETINGQPVGGEAVRNPALPPELVTLNPGASGSATLQVADVLPNDAVKCHAVNAKYLAVYPPEALTPLYINFDAETCTSKVPGGSSSTLGIAVFRTGSGG